MTREEAIQSFQSVGASVTSSVSKTTDILIVGTERGESKYNQALRFGVPIFPEAMFVSLGLSPDPAQIQRLPISDLLTDLILHMATVTDSLYAHSLTLRSPRLFTAFKLGAEATRRLLLAAWGSAAEYDKLRRDWNLASDDDVTRKLARDSLKAWLGVVNTIKNDLPTLQG